MNCQSKASLFEGSSDSEVDFQINKSYAENYEKWRHKEERQKLKDKYGDVSSSSSESEEEVPVIEKDFLKTLSLLKSKDDQIYDKNINFFTKPAETIKLKQKKKSKPVYLKDLERKQILERNGQLSDDEEEEEKQLKTSMLSKYDEEQKQIKDSFKSALQDSDSEEDLFHVRTKNQEEQEKEEEEYIKWLKGKKKTAIDKDSKKELKFLRDFWSDPKLDKNEKFLKDYILQKKYIDDDDDDNSNIIPSYEDITHDIGTLSDDEKLLEKQATFEHKYNFRFEEPDEEFIKHYPRTIGDSLRRKDNKRKEKREDYQERKRLEKEQKKEEIKRLKTLKRKEIQEKLDKLKEITGNDKLGFETFDFDEDFDPSKHDEKMQEMFNDEFYDVHDTEKPQFAPDEELDHENWDEWTGEDHCDQNVAVYDEPHCDDPGFIMDADYDPKLEFQKQMMDSSKSRKRKKKKSRVAEAITKAKPTFDPNEKNFEQYFDEYYRLDFEDIIGDLPVRYKYRKVVPNDFGLSVEEILSAEERELNRWCSLKKTCQYRPENEEIRDVQTFQSRGNNERIKQKVFLSLYGVKEEEQQNGTTSTSKKRKRKSKVQPETDAAKSVATTSANDTKLDKLPNLCTDTNMDDNKDKIQKFNETNETKKRKRKRKSKSTEDLSNSTKTFTVNYEQSPSHKRFKVDESTDSRLKLSDSRLKAYGINPKKFKNRIIYSAKNKAQ